MYQDQLSVHEEMEYEELCHKADDIWNSLEAIETELIELFAALDHGPDLDDEGLNAQTRIQDALTLLKIASGLFHEAHVNGLEIS